MGKTTFALAAILAATLCAGEAAAHARLIHASPRVGATLTQAPGELRLSFSEKIDPAGSAVVLIAPDGARAALGALRLDARDPHVVVAPVPVRLAPGRYRVQWTALSVDSHQTQGDFRFSIAPAP